MLLTSKRVVFFISASLLCITPVYFQKLPRHHGAQIRSDDQRAFSEVFHRNFTENADIKQREECGRWLAHTASVFATDIPPSSVSVVIVAHNENETILKNTIRSLLENTPHNLLKEIIIIDDSSQPPVGLKSNTFDVCVCATFSLIFISFLDIFILIPILY